MGQLSKVALAMFFLLPAVARSADPIVDLPGLGKLRGVARDESVYFRGIPYAAPPVGDLRWRPPQDPAPWSGTRDATDYSPSCIQGASHDVPFTNKSEDCLYLNVYTPSLSPKDLLPVMVWIHGGAFILGGTNSSRTNGAWLVEQYKDIVIVSLNYRLNIFGFLAADDLRGRSPDSSTGNYGIQDQRLALMWVRRYITYFGGNPKNVMLFGESAGGASVATHLVTSKSTGLYHRAVMQSGAFNWWIAQDWAAATENYGKALQLAECADVKCLLTYPAEDLQQAIDGLNWSPVVDGVELSEIPQTLLQKGQFNPVPILVGANRDEGTIFHDLPKTLTSAEYDKFLNDNFGVLRAILVKSVYTPSKYSPTACCTQFYWAANHLIGDYGITCGALRTAKIWGLAQTDVWYYLFNYPPKTVDGNNEFAFHACEIPFVFNSQDNLLDPATEFPIAQTVSSYWHDFAVYGNPNGQGKAVEWPRYDNNTDQSLNFNIETAVRTGDRKSECNLWNSNTLMSVTGNATFDRRFQAFSRPRY
eukprot:TRINITY_DN1779_c0_g1_i1.p1 TRINITY_DN1779_c0_g1~~TRINITY_DN1779_c0_g1_i1.p1  ORF type:complete len:532 (-),score=62.86 TRINITY_DN1779_c0_g1_i1:90-1685(-)